MKKSGFWWNDYDPREEEKSQEVIWKFFTIIFLGIIFFGVPVTRFWFGLWFLLGSVFVVLRIYLSGLRLKVTDWQSFFRREVVSGLKNGMITTDLLMFWPIDFLLTVCFHFFGSRDFSFSFDYYHEQFGYYASGKGRHYGMHVETACELAEADIREAQETGDQIIETLKGVPAKIERQSKFALAVSAIIGFLTTPFTLAQNQEKKKEEERRIYSALIFNLVNPSFNFSLVKLGFDGKKGDTRCLVEGEFTHPVRLSRAFIEHDFGKHLKARIGQQFTPTANFFVPPPDLPTVQVPSIINEIPITAPGITVEYSNPKSVSIEAMLTQDNQKPRFIARVVKAVKHFNFQVAFDKSQKRESVGTQMIFSKGIITTETGGFLSNKGLTAYIQGLVKPFKWLETVVLYESSPWLRLKRRVVLGGSLLFDKIRFRFSWGSDEEKLAAQMTYRF